MLIYLGSGLCKFEKIERLLCWVCLELSKWVQCNLEGPRVREAASGQSVQGWGDMGCEDTTVMVILRGVEFR